MEAVTFSQSRPTITHPTKHNKLHIADASFREELVELFAFNTLVAPSHSDNLNKLATNLVQTNRIQCTVP